MEVTLSTEVTAVEVVIAAFNDGGSGASIDKGEDI